MKVKILMFILLLVISISLSNAIKTVIVNETELVSLKLKARDEDGDKLFYSFTEPLDEEGKWQTNYGDEGEYKVRVTVSDGELSTSKDILLIVKKKNVGPSIGSFSPMEEEIIIDEGESMDFNVKASDLNKDLLKYEWKFDEKAVGAEQVYSYRVDYWDEGEHKINVVVSDGEEEDEKEWIVKVNDVDREALLDDIKDIEVDEGDIIKLDLPDFKKYNLEYTISEPISNDNYWETGYDDSGLYNVTITMRDRNFSVSKTIEVIVRDKDRKPVFKPIANVWMKENQKVSIELEAYDPDNDEIEFYVESLPGGALIEGNLFEWITDYDTVRKESRVDKALDKFHLLYKPFRIIFVAKGNELEARQSVLIIVKDINRAPVLEDIPPIMVNEGEEVVIKPEASDPDGDNVTYSYSGWMDLDRRITDYDDAGVYRVKVIASDGFLRDERYITIEVKDANRAPVFDEISSMEINENEGLELKLYASDPDGDSVDISAESLPRNSTIKENIFIWTPDYDTVNADFNIYAINFKASDGKDETIKKANVTVYNVNRVPKIVSTDPGRSITVKRNEKIRFEVSVEDPDGDELRYLWKFGLLEQYKADAAMVRTFTTVGNKKIKVVVSDGEDEASYEWEVKVV